MKWCVSAWTIWGLRAEWTLNMGTEASKGWLFCGDAARSRISQDRKNYFLRDCAYCRFEYICRTVVWLRQQALRWEAAGLRLKLKERRTWTGWKILLWRWRRRTLTISQDRQKYVFFNLFDCFLEKLQDLCCECMLCAEIGPLTVKCWHFLKVWFVYKSLYAFDVIKNSITLRVF